MTIEQTALLITSLSALGGLAVAAISMSRIQTLHVLINSRLDQLLTSSRALSHAEGREEMRKEEQERASIGLDDPQ